MFILNRIASCGLFCALAVLCPRPLFAQDAELSPTVLRTFKTGADGQKARLGPPVLSRDGTRLALYVVANEGEDSRTVVYDVKSGNKVYELATRGEQRAVRVVALSPDGRRAGIVTHNADITTEFDVVDLASGKSIYHVAGPIADAQASFSPDGRHLLHGLALVDLDSGKVQTKLRLGEWDRLTGVVSSDGKRLITADSNTNVVKVWDVMESKLVSTLEMAERDAGAMVFLPGNETIRGVNGRGVVQTWDVATGRRCSRVEPQELIQPGEGGVAFTDDGKTVLFVGHGGINFRDAETAKSLGIWHHGPEDGSIAYADTLQGNTIVVNVEGAFERGDVAVIRLPKSQELAPPMNAAKARDDLRVRVAGTTSPPVAVPPHADADLRNPLWWLDRAEAELNATTDGELRSRLVTSLVVARAAAGDDAGLQRMMKAAVAIHPNEREWPMDEVNIQVARHRARRLVRAGKTAEAIAVAKAVLGTNPQSDGALADVAVEQALAGDVDGAIATTTSLRGSFVGRTQERAVRMLLAAGKLVDAERLAERTTDPSWQGQAFDRIAEAKARIGDANGATASLGHVHKNQRVGAVKKVIAALARQRHDDAARRVIESLPVAEQNDAWSWLAQGQLDRDDLDAAIATSKKVTDNPAYYFRVSLAVAQARLGRTKEAIATATAGRTASDLAPAVFGELLRAGRLDAATDLLAKLPPPRDPTSNDHRQAYAKELARAMAEAGRIADAERLLASAPPQPNAREGNTDPRHEAAAWTIAAAKHRTGDAAGYAAARQPLLDAVRNAAGGPSRAKAQLQLFRFQIATGDFAAAETLVPTIDPQLYRSVATVLAKELEPYAKRRDDKKTSLDLNRGRAMVRLVATVMDRALTGNLIAALARPHAEAGKFDDWLDWTRSLPTTVSRAVAYEAMAEALLPAEPQEPRD